MRSIADLLGLEPGTQATAQGWVRTKRLAKEVCFLELNDGSCLAGLQAVVGRGDAEMDRLLEEVQTGAAVCAEGLLATSPAAGQRVELQVNRLIEIGPSPSDGYPLQKKRHSFEFLRTISHLRARTNTIGAIARVRNRLSMAIHDFFQRRGFLYLQTPIITPLDAEGAGDLFRVDAPDFFDRPAYLTVSGQLNAEAYASALGKVYTFGPTFRAEHSNTTRHLAEFWMVEPEVAFCDLAGIGDLAEEFLKELIHCVLTDCTEEMHLFDKRIAPGLINALDAVATSTVRRIGYTEAIEALTRSGREFQFEPRWGADLHTEHERFLTEEAYGTPLIVTDWPRQIKAFYMRQNEDGRTVRAMDLLVPRLGEIIGGSQREERYDRLVATMEAAHLDLDRYWWYLDLRRFGSVPHAGFGLGFERLVQYVTGMANIRDVIPFPRTVGSIEF